MDSIIFDLDGTLWDSVDTVKDTWNKTLQEHGVDKELTREDIESIMGLQMKEIGEKLLPDLSEERRTHLMSVCGDNESGHLEAHGGKLYPNLEHVLETLSKKYKLFIVSNCQVGYIEAFYAAHKLDKYFIDFENPGRTGLSKGENIKLVMERNELSSPVYVGDIAGDQKAAKHAGIPFVYAKYGFGEVDEYDYVLEEVEDLLKLF